MSEKLTQDIFKDAPAWVKSAAVDKDGSLYGYETTKSEIRPYHFFKKWGYVDMMTDQYAWFFGMGYNVANWKSSAIDREVNESP